jgi:hypothetical protein
LFAQSVSHRCRALLTAEPQLYAKVCARSIQIEIPGLSTWRAGERT